MKVHICTRCPTPCYLIDMCKANQAVPYTCPHSGEANWNETTIEDLKDRLEEV